MAIVDAYVDQVQEIYIAYYGRPADPVGLDFWTNELDAADGDLTAIIDAFGNSDEADSLFGGLSTEQTVNTLYNQLFGRDADIEGLLFYTGELTAGRMTLASIALNILDGAQNDDATIIANKVAVANDFTDSLDTASEILAYSGDVAAESARDLLATVDDTTDTETFDVDTTIAELDGAQSGETFVLTEEIDEFEASDAASADTVKGILGGTDTLSVGDTIVGNGATILQVAVTANDSIPFVDVSGIDKLNVVAAGATDLTGSAANLGSLNEVNLSGADGLDVNLTGVEMGASFDVSIAAAAQTATLDLSGEQGNWDVSIELHNTGSGAEGTVALGGIGVEAVAMDGGDFCLTATLSDSATSAAASIGDIAIGDIDLTATGDATACASLDICAEANTTGDATVGNVTIGSLTNTVGTNDVCFDLEVYACADSGDATIGNVTVGEVALVATDNGLAYASISADACVTTGNATVGDMTIGDITATAATSGTACFYAWQDAEVTGDGDATVGNVTVGDVTVALADDAEMSISVSATADVSGDGNAVVGDVSIGNVTVDLADSSACLYVYADGDADADGSGDATMGNVTIGDITATMGEDGYLEVCASGCAAADTGDATVGDVSIGSLDLTMGSGADAEVCVMAYADGTSASASGVIGDLSIGDIDLDMNLDTCLMVCVSASASGSGTGTAIGDVTVGDITAAGSVALSACVDLEVTLDSEGSVGALTVGAIDVELLSSSCLSIDVDVSATGDLGAVNLGDVTASVEDVDYDVSLSADNMTAGVTIGNVSLDADDVNYRGVIIDAAGDVGDVVIGDVTITAATNLTLGTAGISIAADGDVNSVTVGDISIDSANSETLNIDVSATDDLGDVTVGNITLAVADSAVLSLDADVVGQADVGNVTFGNVDFGAVNATASANIFVDAATGDALGDVTLGDITLAASATASTDAGAAANFTAIAGSTADTVGVVAIGDITLNVTAENTSAGAEATNENVTASVNITATGATATSVTVGDIDINLSNSVDDSTGFTGTDNYNLAVGNVAITADEALTVGDINLTATNGTLDVESVSNTALFSASVDLDAGTADMTIGDITVVGGDVDTASNVLDNFANLTGWLSASTTGTVTVGDIDYSGYAADATIDVSGFDGAANITAGAGDTTITVNDGTNNITLGAGADDVVYTTDEAAGTTYADIDKISGFTSGTDDIDLSAVITDNFDIGGTVADYDAFMAAAEAAMAFDNSIDAFAMNDGTNTYIAVNSDDSGNGDIEFVIELTGITSVTSGDVI